MKRIYGEVTLSTKENLGSRFPSPTPSIAQHYSYTEHIMINYLMKKWRAYSRTNRHLSPISKTYIRNSVLYYKYLSKVVQYHVFAKLQLISVVKKGTFKFSYIFITLFIFVALQLKLTEIVCSPKYLVVKHSEQKYFDNSN